MRSRFFLVGALLAALPFGLALALEPPFTQVREISDGILGNNSTCTGRVAIVDIDGDGDLDVFSGGGGGGTHGYRLRLHSNKKKGKKWSTKIIQKVGTDRERNSYGWNLVDLDGDKDLDVVFASSDRKGRGLAWLENKGKGKAWEHTMLYKTKDHYADADGGDLDKDGDVDIVTAHYRKLLWLSNPGPDAEEGDEWELITPSFKGAMFSFVALRLADLDGDGDLDVASVHQEHLKYQVFWHENQSGGFKFVPHKLREATGRGPSLLITDLNKDGKPDILAGSTMDLIFFENLGGGSIGEEVLATAKDDGPSLGAAAVGDIDGDGDLDIYVNCGWVNRGAPSAGLRWLENDEGDFEEHIIGGREWTQAVGIGAGDLDGDGDADLALGHNRLRKVVWVVNRSKQK